jgi:hypothetical protein
MERSSLPDKAKDYRLNCVLCLIRDKGDRIRGGRIEPKSSGTLYPKGNTNGQYAHLKCYLKAFHEERRLLPVPEPEPDPEPESAFLDQRSSSMASSGQSHDLTLANPPSPVEPLSPLDVGMEDVWSEAFMASSSSSLASTESAAAAAVSESHRPPDPAEASSVASVASLVPMQIDEGDGHSTPLSAPAASVPREPWLERQLAAQPQEYPAFFDTYRAVCLNKTDATLQAALKARNLRITDEERRDGGITTRIAGGVTMFECEKLACWQADSTLRKTFTDMAFESATRAGRDVLHLTHSMVSPKLLKVEPGAGEQIIHWDTAEAWNGNGTFAVILNCSLDEVQSTAVPIYSTAQEFAFANPLIPTGPELRARVELLQPEFFHSVAFRRANVMFFEQTIPHKGTKNTSNSLRVVFFCLLCEARVPPRVSSRRGRADIRAVSSMMAEPEDANQFFTWLYYYRAYVETDDEGIEKNWPIEYAQVLLDNAQETPVERYRDEQDVKYAKECLKRHGMLAAYNKRAKLNNDAYAAREQERRRKAVILGEQKEADATFD